MRDDKLPLLVLIVVYVSVSPCSNLSIKRHFDENPILWSLLQLLAEGLVYMYILTHLESMKSSTPQNLIAVML